MRIAVHAFEPASRCSTSPCRCSSSARSPGRASPTAGGCQVWTEAPTASRTVEGLRGRRGRRSPTSSRRRTWWCSRPGTPTSDRPPPSCPGWWARAHQRGARVAGLCSSARSLSSTAAWWASVRSSPTGPPPPRWRTAGRRSHRRRLLALPRPRRRAHLGRDGLGHRRVPARGARRAGVCRGDDRHATSWSRPPRGRAGAVRRASDPRPGEGRPARSDAGLGVGQPRRGPRCRGTCRPRRNEPPSSTDASSRSPAPRLRGGSLPAGSTGRADSWRTPTGRSSASLASAVSPARSPSGRTSRLPSRRRPRRTASGSRPPDRRIGPQP